MAENQPITSSKNLEKLFDRRRSSGVAIGSGGFTAGFTTTDVDEIYCKSLSGQCNVYSLHVIRGENDKDDDKEDDDEDREKKKNGEWILVVTLSGKLFRFATSDDDLHSNSSMTTPKFVCTEFDLRNEFPSHYIDLEVASSCVHQFGDQTYLFLACVDNRPHLMSSTTATAASDGGRNPSGTSGNTVVSINAPGIVFIVRLSPPSSSTSTMATVVRTLTTSYAPCLITVFPLRRSESDKTVDDHILLVSGTDRSIHGYRIEMSNSSGGSMASSDHRLHRGQLTTCECFLGETLTEFDTLLLLRRRSGKPLPGVVLQLDVAYARTLRFDRLVSLGFDSGNVINCHADAIRNELLVDPVDAHFDGPISALMFVPWDHNNNSDSNDGEENHHEHPSRISLLICSAIGSARLYSNVDDTHWTVDGPAAVQFPRSDHFDCITCAESIVADGSTYILLGTFGGKVLIYSLDKERTTATLKRIHSFLSPVMKIRTISRKYIAVLLTYTLMIFEL